MQRNDNRERDYGRALGGVAFARGIIAACNDPEAMAHMAGREIGQSTPFLTGWCEGWAMANLAASVPE